MSKLIVVFGATGQQGGSVINTIITDPQLSREYKVRGITRDPFKPAALALKHQNVEVMPATLEEPASLKAALKGAHTVFSVTATVYDEQLAEREVTHGKAIADAAVTAGAHYIIYSSAVPAYQLSGHEMDIFDSKASVEAYIRTLPIHSAFFAPGIFMQNFGSMMAPQPTSDAGVYAITNIIAPDTMLPLIDIVADAGRYVGAVLADPEMYEGKVLWAATSLQSMREVAAAIEKAKGRTVRYEQVDKEIFSGFLPATSAKYTVDMMQFIQDPGYYGRETKERVEWSTKQARGSLSSLEEFLARTPLLLD